MTQDEIKAQIRSASDQAQRDLAVLDKNTQAEVERIYKDAAMLLSNRINAYADTYGQVPLYVLQDILRQVEATLAALAAERAAVLQVAMDEAVVIGTMPFAAVLSAEVVFKINSDTVKFVTKFIANDGLQLSDRLWRIDNHASSVIGDAIKRGVTLGQSASQAADDLLANGQTVPAALRARMGDALADKLAKNAADALLTGDGQQSPRYNAMRIMRTEINRAHGEAYNAAVFEHPYTVATKFLLSSNHKRKDICDMHANANLYGLGKGVYPKGKNPWPAHPNTISFTVVVFKDEVTDADKQGKESRIDWIKKQPVATRESVLGGKNKRQAFDNGKIKDSEIEKPWRVLKQRD